MNEELFEKYNLFIRGADPEATFTPAEQFDLINFGILKKIVQNPDLDSFELLKTIITTTTNTDLLQSCFEDLNSLAKSGNRLAVFCVFDLAIEYSNNTAIEIINKYQLSSTRNAVDAAFYLLTNQVKSLFNLPRPLYALQSYYRQAAEITREKMRNAAHKLEITDWHFVVSCVDVETPSDEDILLTYNSMSTESKRFFLGQLIYHIVSGQKKFLSPLLNLFLHTEEELLHNFLNSRLVKFLPEQNYALFLLIDEQWQKVQEVDPGDKYLQQAYQESDNYLRLKILQKTRTAGIDLVFSDAAKQKKLINLDDLSYDDWTAIMESQGTEEHLNTIWRLAQIAPPYWSIRILSHLKTHNYRPANNDEASFYDLLIPDLPELPFDCQKSLLIKERDHSLSSDYQYAVVHQGKGAFYSKKNNVIHFIESLDQPKIDIQEIFPPKPLMPAIQFSTDGKYLLWADVDQMINIYECKSDRIIKRYAAQKSIIRSLITSTDQKHLFSASFDGTIQSWRFPDGFHEKEITSERNEIYSMVLSDLGQYLISGNINGKIQIISTESMECIHEFSANNNAILSISQPKRQMIASNTASNHILIWNYLSRKMLNQYENLEQFGNITKLLLSSEENILIQATNKGNLLVRDPLSGTLYEHSKFDDLPILDIEEYDHRLWLFQQNGNFQMLNTILLHYALSPIKQSGDRQLKQLDELLSLPNLSKFQQKWLEFIKKLVHWQKRFDISIEELQSSISIDDFSITI